MLSQMQDQGIARRRRRVSRAPFLHDEDSACRKTDNGGVQTNAKGIGFGHRQTLAAAFVVALMSIGSGSASAADLGGDCCVDLEERVAELEATTVRKGNKKVKVELYGRLNRVVAFWDDGAEENAYVLNSFYSPSRFGVRGKANISDNWSSKYILELEDGASLGRPSLLPFAGNSKSGGKDTSVESFPIIRPLISRSLLMVLEWSHRQGARPIGR